jgi:RNA polymerase sigma-70 factor (ECF subfamily)
VDDSGEAALLARLRAGDESTFARVFEEHHPMLVRLALAFVKNPSVAEDVAQDTWVAAMDALDTFEARSSFKTWIARIAINRAKTRAVRDGRNVSWSADEGEGTESRDETRFNGWGIWRTRPTHWDETPEGFALRREVREAILAGLASLPDAQRAVVTMRDLEGFDSEEVCNALDLSESNQRVLLHRGRSRLRAVLERALMGDSRP